MCRFIWNRYKRDHRRLNELMYKYIRGFHPTIIDSIIVPDALLSWYGAFIGEPGIVVIGGTGYIVYGNNKGVDAYSSMEGIRRNWQDVVHLGGRHISYHALVGILKKAF